ncbi:putative F-box protein At3g52320 isoform X2 [Silene latifolia]|uniref:putative F-box protein At3g52320 isoform X2 n=1 Tax=Silene latifolia TaxID=37657 RepID=UPI003D777474
MALSLHRYTNRLPNPNYPLFQLLKHRTRVEREKSMLIYIAPENGNRLPENVLIEILTWLPVKEVLQYKSVCKSWYSILSSPQFISKHLKNNRHRYIDNCLLALFPVTSAESNLCELLIDETPRVLEDKVLYGIPEYGAYICGPCDGLYYLCAYSYRALWNPSINEQFEGRRLVLCDPNTLEIKDLGYNGPGRCMGLFCYMESLLSIKDNMNKCREDEQEQVETDITQV